MPRYLIKKETTFTVQEGDTPSPIEFYVPAVLDMDGYEIRIKVFDKNGRTLISKDSNIGTITISDQLVTMNLDEADTKGRAGTQRWEAELYNDSPEKITIGRGPFVINAQKIV